MAIFSLFVREQHGACALVTLSPPPLHPDWWFTTVNRLIQPPSFLSLLIPYRPYPQTPDFALLEPYEKVFGEPMLEQICHRQQTTAFINTSQNLQVTIALEVDDFPLIFVIHMFMNSNTETMW
jgi:hypothetical protein